MYLMLQPSVNINSLSFMFQDGGGLLAAAGGGGGEGRGWGGRGEAQLAMPFEGDSLGLRCLPGNGSELGCPFCGFISRGKNFRQNLQNHLLTHTGEKPYQCSECPMRCLKKSNLKRHMQRQHHTLTSLPLSRLASGDNFDQNIRWRSLELMVAAV